MQRAGKTRFERVNFPKVSRFLLDFDLKPAQLEAYLDDYIVGQKEAKAIISTKICTHFHKIKNILLRKIPEDPAGFIKNNILIIGPTGVGKTYTIKLIAKKVGVPFVKGDATKFSETGYVGGDIEDLIKELYWEAGRDIEKARFGMIFLDEIDKIASAGSSNGPDVSRTGVQRGLLKPLEETEVEIKIDPDSGDESGRKRLVLNTRYVLFVASGAFHGLEEIIQKRLNSRKMGFLSELQSKEEVKFNWLRMVTPEDLVKYGFEREFVGRFPIIVVFDPLQEEELYQILANPNSVIVLNKKRDFKVYGIDIAFTDDALREVATRAYKEGTGARALSRILENALIFFESTLPSYNFEVLGVTKELIEDPEGYLRAMLQNPQSDRWKQAYLQALEDEKERFKNFLDKKPFEKDEFLNLTPFRIKLLFKLYKSREMDVNQALIELTTLWRQIKIYEHTYSRKRRVVIKFSEEAVDYLLEKAVEKGVSIYSICDGALTNIEYVLDFFREIRMPVIITPLAFQGPQKFLQRLFEEMKDEER